MDRAPIGVLIGIPEMEKRNAEIDLGGQYVCFTIEKKSVRIGLEPDRTFNKQEWDLSEDEDFSTDSSSTSSVESSDDEDEKSIVVSLATQIKEEAHDMSRSKQITDQESKVFDKLSHLREAERKKLQSFFFKMKYWLGRYMIFEWQLCLSNTVLNSPTSIQFTTDQEDVTKA